MYRRRPCFSSDTYLEHMIPSKYELANKLTRPLADLVTVSTAEMDLMGIPCGKNDKSKLGNNNVLLGFFTAISLFVSSHYVESLYRSWKLKSNILPLIYLLQVVWRKSADPHPISIGELIYAPDTRYDVRITPARREYNLLIKGVKRSDAGVYECQVSSREKLFRLILLRVKGTLSWYKTIR